MVRGLQALRRLIARASLIAPRIAGPAWGLLPFSRRFAWLHGRGPAGIARAKYIETFVENIKWSEVSKRFGA